MSNTILVGQLVIAYWVDSRRWTDWTYEKPSLALAKHESVGWITAMDADAINICPHRAKDADGETQHCGDITIPRAAVTDIKVVV